MTAFVQTDAYIIRHYETDANGRLSVPALLNFMQESANRNALEYGISMAELGAQSLGWLLMRLRLTIHQMPTYGQVIEVVTYPTQVEKYFIHRDFWILNEQGRVLAEAGSTWAVFDLNRRSMITLPAFIRSLDVPQGVMRSEPLPLKPDFSVVRALATEQARRVEWSQLDTNQHTNNVAYVQWLLESLPDGVLQERAPQTIDLFFRAESRWHDQLLVQTALLPDGSFGHRTSRADDGREVLLARSVWTTG